MDKLPKSALLLFFVSLLSFAGIEESFCESSVYPESSVKASPNDKEAGYSQSEQLRFQFLHKVGETLVGAMGSVPASGSKHSTFGFLCAGRSLEQRLQITAARYLLWSKGISRSLTTGDIVFPFHYFW